MGTEKLLLYALLLIVSGLPRFVPGQHLACDQRRIEGHSPIKQGGDGGFRVGILGPLASRGQYVPNEVYTVTVQGVKTRYSTQKFTEFLLVSESEKQAMVGASGLVTTGLFHIVDESKTRFSDICPDGVTSVNRQPKAEVSILWTAPSVLVASCITFKVTVVERPHVWFMDEGQLSMTLCPQGPPPPPTTATTATTTPAATTTITSVTASPVKSQGQQIEVVTPRPTPSTTTPPPEPPPSSSDECCACDDAKYDVMFEGIWSKETHPKDFPDNEWLVHFSDIIGASHTPNMSLYQIGQPASEGIRAVAEWGSIRQLETELMGQASSINTIIKARGLWHPNEKGTSVAAFRVDRWRPLVSLVSMLGPSPDWIVGVTGLQLCLPNCTWLPEISIDLYPLDAGTDSGITYMSPNTPTNPSGPIVPLTPTSPDDPRSPFHGLAKLDPFAKLKIERTRIYPRECSDTTKSSTLFLAENSQNDVERPECAVLDWTPWSECSVRCGKGLRMRKRNYAIPMKADMMRCDRQLVEKEMCLGAQPNCPADDPDDEGICSLTPWSEWSPCSATCGNGTRTRTRRYKNHMGRKKCGSSVDLTGSEDCSGPVPCSSNNPANLAPTNGAASPSDPSGDDPTCPLSPWSEWSPCSVSCGAGIRLRSRILLNPEVCSSRSTGSGDALREAEDCVGEYGEACTVQREEAEQLCPLHPDQGPCRDNLLRFYYHEQKGMCLPFTYGGCKGNRNRFDSVEECQQVCGFLSSSPPAGQTDTTTPTTFSTTLKASFVRTTPPPPIRTTTTTVATHPPPPSSSTSSLRRNWYIGIEPTTAQPYLESEESFNLDLGAATDPPSDSYYLNPLPQLEEDEPLRVDCVVSAWSEWSPCSVSCGTSGFRTRTRNVLIQPSSSGRRCPRKLGKRKSCAMPPC